ncbi:MAG: hypothetical protein GOMPHAMPRED_002728 [Gomphillus americanus]|uniref:Uncharacterized protein n=1 Tax=Gomphillus americanus TaxID=1940652 RepID=A0A8H3FEN6_9LECA|nr:MAG: hypothetical protein GOMPHAMPRED_002728 [Gomphillus americanus]
MSSTFSRTHLDTIPEEEEGDEPAYIDTIRFAGRPYFTTDQWPNPDARDGWLWLPGENRERYKEMLQARDNFLIGTIQFLIHRIREMRQATQVFRRKTPLWEASKSLPYPVYSRIFKRVCHLENRQTLFASVLSSKAVNYTAQQLGLDPLPHRRHPARSYGRGRPRTFARDHDLGFDRGYSAFNEMVESFVLLSTSCKESTHNHSGRIFWIEVIRSNTIRWALLLTKAIDYIRCGLNIMKEGNINEGSGFEEWDRFMQLVLAIDDVLAHPADPEPTQSMIG